ncbi:MAG: CpaE family protein [Gemmatimonadota bacterium]
MTTSDDTKAGRPVPAAVISTDPALGEALRAALPRVDATVVLGLEVDLPFTEIDDEYLDRLRSLDPEVIFLDLESNPHVGLKFAQFLAESGIGRALIGVGPTESPTLLLEAMQAGLAEYVPKPVQGEQVRGALERVLRRTGRLVEERRHEPGLVVPIFSAKGGAGSTTVAANLAIEIHRLTRKKALLVDLDLELGETALLLGMQPKFSVVDLIRNLHRVDAGLLQSYIERHETGVELLSAPYEPADVESVSGDRVRQVLTSLRRHYDYVVVDSPKTLNTATLAAFDDAETLYLLVTGDLPSLRNMVRCLPLLRKMAPKRPEDWLRVVVNRFNPNDVISTAEIEKTLQLKVFRTIRNDYRTVIRSINEGEPAVMQRKSHFARDVRELAAEITGVPVGGDRGGRFLSRLFARRNGKAPGRRQPVPRRDRVGEAHEVSSHE